MPQETLGYVELEWTCKRCGTRNPGLQKKCTGCGSPMSEQDKFEAPVQQQLITDAAQLAQAESGPDIHCPYCGARSPAGSARCVQCGASLTDAKAREAGQVVGAFQAGAAPTVACPYCQAPNPPNAARCQKCGGALQKPVAAAPKPAPAGTALGLGLAGAAVLALCICAIGWIVLSGRTTDTPAVVQSVAWERIIQIEELRPVEHQDWEDQLPANVRTGSCEKKFRRMQSEPAPGAEKVCGTPYTVDQGSGVGKVVQDCQYKVYDNWCTYTRDEWTVVDQAIAHGSDANPYWPDPSLRSGQRAGQRAEKYIVTFSANDKRDAFTYNVGSADELSRFRVGSRWMLKVNTFGGVVDAQPAP